MADRHAAPRLAALVFTDVVKSVDLKSRLGDVAAAALLGRHSAIVKWALETTPGGRVLQDTGDGFLIRFNTATDAVNFALRLQYALAREPWKGPPLHVRVGIHLGDVWETDSLEAGFNKLTGLTVDLTARIMAMGEGGQILLTRAVFDSARQNVRRHPRCDTAVPPALNWASHGTYLLNGIGESTELFEVRAKGIAPLHPPGDSQKGQRLAPPEDRSEAGKHALRQRRFGPAGIFAVLLVLAGAAGAEFVRRHFFNATRAAPVLAPVPAKIAATAPARLVESVGPATRAKATAPSALPPSATRPVEPAVVHAPPDPAIVHAPAGNFRMFHNPLGMKFVHIRPGEFTMGSPTTEAGHEPAEVQHKVKITRPFFMGMHHVTRMQFAAFVGDTGYKTEAEKEGSAWVFEMPEFKKQPGDWRSPGFEQGDKHPVVAVSWNDAMAFVKWLNKTEPAHHYRLPTEAEWEYACRAGTQTAYYWGDNPEGGQGFANCADQTFEEKYSTHFSFAWRDGFVYTSPVAFFKPNPWGLHDMIGNAWVWCSDYHGPYTGDATDPTGLAAPKRDNAMGFRVIRGAAWNFGPRRARSASRGWQAPNQSRNNVGIRLCAEN